MIRRGPNPAGFNLDSKPGKGGDQEQNGSRKKGRAGGTSLVKDSPLVLHLHGYDIEAEVTPHSPAVMRFTAHASGRFPVEHHDGSGHKT
ncbi:MAG: hypothetical protein Ct9H300mP16_08320 [Pseudomonadota bacterium]|nr:MAG: hypothetical protein Ct9H300mP16_08320 [Pseudomonadota bacterium]